MIVVQFSMSFCFACCLSAACLLYHIRFRLSRGFSNFFQVFSRILSDQHPACRQPVYYITSASLCQEVFQTFLKFFRLRFRLFYSLVDSFDIVSQPIRFVNSFFPLFFIFVQLSQSSITSSDIPRHFKQPPCSHVGITKKSRA